MDLLIIKHKDMYVRVKDAAYFLVGLDKASVFPLAKLETVREHVQTLREQGFDPVAIYRLKLSEEPYDPNHKLF
ncbi:MAG: hypothetical protein LJE96_10440 [Deltaproteobacteria bacterium]|jgi:hypothetical protein|nr:hypothetical protein [Deltaproteobacteria bacterium]